jgi:hypothetical protein
MIWNTIPDDERLRLWKKLRDDVKDFTLENQLQEVAKFCSKIPFGTRTIDYYSTEEWPTPWEILFYSSFCTSSISLLIFYTLTLIPINAAVELQLVEDEGGIYLLPIIDNQFVLNYELGAVNKISEIQDNITVLKKYQQEHIKTIT